MAKKQIYIVGFFAPPESSIYKELVNVPKSLKEKGFLKTKKGNKVELVFTPPLKLEEVLGCSNIIIAPGTRDAEETVRSLMKGSYLIARYSNSYGNPSKYSENEPWTSGYAFDIPKDPECLEELLKSDEFFESILSRDIYKIGLSIDKINVNLKSKGKSPIIPTPYLFVLFKDFNPENLSFESLS